MKPKRYPYSGQKKKESNAIVKLAFDSSKIADLAVDSKNINGEIISLATRGILPVSRATSKELL